MLDSELIFTYKRNPNINHQRDPFHTDFGAIENVTFIFFPKAPKSSKSHKNSQSLWIVRFNQDPSIINKT